MTNARGVPRVDHTQQPALEQIIRDTLAADPRCRFQSVAVHVAVDTSQIRLEGWVPSLADRVRIGTTVTNLIHPQTVDNSLRVGPPNQRPDLDIRRSIQDVLEEDRAIDSTAIQVQVIDGVVHLSGIVDTSIHQRYAAALCWWVPGVRGVQNELSPIYPEPFDDELLAEVIQEVFEKDPLVDRTEILVLSHNFSVTLAGTVGGADARDAAESDAWSVEGVRDVANQIEVVNIPGGGPILGLDG